MNCPNCAAELLEEFAQLLRRNAVVEFAANDHIGPILALILAELARHAD
jgi:hypothetical protein